MASKYTLHPLNIMEENYDDIYDPHPQSPIETPSYVRHTGQPVKPFKLYVGNLPVDFSEEGIANLFKTIGVEPLDVFRFQPQQGAQFTWAFVYFDSKRIAQYVIQELDHQPPFNLRIQYAHNEAKKERTRTDRERNELWQPALQTDTLMAPEIPLRRSPGKYSPHAGEERNLGCREDYYDDFYDEGGYNISDRPAMQRISLTLNSSNGVRQVALERGHIPDSGSSDVLPKTTSSYKRVSGNVDCGYGEYPPEDQSLRAPCVFCNRMTTSCCARCGDSYCSRACQLRDYSKHRKVCVPLPELSDRCQTLSPTTKEMPGLLCSSQEILDPKLHNAKAFAGKSNCVTNGNYSEKNSVQPLMDQKKMPVVVKNERSNFVKKQNNESSLANLACKTSASQCDNASNLPKQANFRSNNSWCAGEVTSKLNSQSTESRPMAQNSYNRNNSNVHSDTQRNNFEISNDQSNIQRKRDPVHRLEQSNFQLHESSNNIGRSDTGKRYDNSNQQGNEFKNNCHNRAFNNGQRRKEQINRNCQRNNGQRNQSNRGMQNNNCPNNQKNNYKPRNSGNFRNNVDQSNLRRHNHSFHEKTSNSNNGQRMAQRESVGNSGNYQQDRFVNCNGSEQHSVSSGDNTNNDIDKGNGQDVVAPKANISELLTTAYSDYTSQELQSDKNLPCECKDVLPKDEFVEVKVAAQVTDFEFWVWKLQKVNSLMEMLQVANEKCPATTAVAPIKGKVFSAPFLGDWYRAKIVEIEPEIQAEFIDYGNIEIVKAEDVRPLLLEFKDLPGLAMKIKFMDGTPNNFANLPEGESITIKSVCKMPDGTSVVVVEGYEPASVKKDLNCSINTTKPEEAIVNDVQQIKLGDIIDRSQRSKPIYHFMSVKDEGYCQFHKALNPNQFTVNLIAQGVITLFQHLINLQEACDSLPEDDSYRPVVGDIVAAKSSDEWRRASVMAILDNSYHVHYLDLGYTEEVKCIRKLPDEFRSIPEFGLEATVVEFFKPEEIVRSKYLKPDAKFSFELVEKFEDRAVICLKNSSNEEALCSVELNKYNPMKESRGLKSLKLVSGSKVIISNILNSGTLHLKPTEGELGLTSAKTLQLVVSHCHTAKPLDHFPQKGDLVACKFNLDGRYYRAQVRSIVEENIGVSYIDFGNDDTVKLDCLLALSEELKEMPATAIMAHLNGITDEPLTNDAALFIQEFIAQETEMKVVFNSLPEDGVDLYLPDGTHLNKKMEELLMTTWKKSASSMDEPGIYKYVDLPNNQLPLESPINLIIYHYKEGTVAGIVGDEGVAASLDALDRKVNEYCSSITSENFLPKVNELVFAVFEGAWYRAVCKEVSQNVVQVFFIDYGNTESVPLTDLRKMVSEFMSIPAVAFIGKLQGCGDDITESFEQKMNSIIQIPTSYAGKILKTANGDYIIDIPSIKEAVA